jgi:hypothetical protein
VNRGETSPLWKEERVICEREIDNSEKKVRKKLKTVTDVSDFPLLSSV